MSESTTVLIIASSSRLRDGLRVLLRASTKITHIAQADDLPSGLCQVAQVRPDLVLLDADLLNEQTWQAVQHIQQYRPQCGCVLLTHSARQAHLAQANGATAILPDGFSTEVLFNIIARYKEMSKDENLS